MGAVRVRDLEVRFRFVDDKRGLLSGAGQDGLYSYGLPEDDTLAIAPADSEQAGVREESEGVFRTVSYSGGAGGPGRRVHGSSRDVVGARRSAPRSPGSSSPRRPG